MSLYAEFHLRRNEARGARVPPTRVGPRLPDTEPDALLLLHSDLKQNRIPPTFNLFFFFLKDRNGCLCGFNNDIPKTRNFWL